MAVKRNNYLILISFHISHQVEHSLNTTRIVKTRVIRIIRPKMPDIRITRLKIQGIKIILNKTHGIRIILSNPKYIIISNSLPRRPLPIINSHSRVAYPLQQRSVMVERKARTSSTIHLLKKGR